MCAGTRAPRAQHGDSPAAHTTHACTCDLAETTLLQRSPILGSATITGQAQGQPRDTCPVPEAAELIAYALAGSERVLGGWWPAAQVLRGLARVGITDRAVVDAALAQLGVEVRSERGRRARWRLARPPAPARSREVIEVCGCGQREREWRRPGGAWFCMLCHPPVFGITTEQRPAATPSGGATARASRSGLGRGGGHA
jgi:hypothetical protein